MSDPRFTSLIEFLNRIPSIHGEIGLRIEDNGTWWVKFAIDIYHQLAWPTVQEFGHVLNYLTFDEKLPTSFYPVSPPPYINGGSAEFLSWVIESHDPKFTPDTCAKWLIGRLPKPVDDISQWTIED
jgi:hypothetical protein